MSRMPQIGRDPFRAAEDYNRQMTSLGAQGEQAAQNALMQMFVTEAARQAPWARLPVDLAKQNNAARNSFNNSVALSNYKAGLPLPQNKITKMIWDTAKNMGVDPILALTIADIETGGRFDPNAKNPKSSAYGLFQQIDANWEQYGQGYDRRNPQHQTQAGIAYMRDVIDTIQQSGQEPTPGLVYFGYQQGPGALAKVLANPNAPVEQVLGVDAARLNGARRGESAMNFLRRWSSKAEQRYAQHKAVRSRQQDDDDSKTTLIYGNKKFNLNDYSGEEDDEDAS